VRSSTRQKQTSRHATRFFAEDAKAKLDARPTKEGLKSKSAAPAPCAGGLEERGTRIGDQARYVIAVRNSYCTCKRLPLETGQGTLGTISLVHKVLKPVYLAGSNALVQISDDCVQSSNHQCRFVSSAGDRMTEMSQLGILKYEYELALARYISRSCKPLFFVQFNPSL
jgi:hypothetical protein